MNNRLLTTPQNDVLGGRQIAFFAAFVLPVYKLLEAPSVLARFAKGDLLLPALLHYVLQAGVLAALLYAASRSETPLLERLQQKIGKWIYAVYIAYGVYFLFAAALPLLDLEKFIYAAFYDTSPTAFSFAAFFLFAAFLCSRGLKTTGRIADFCLFLFLIPFLSLLFMALSEADATNLLPFFEQKFGATMSAFTYTMPHFSDVALLLPLVGTLRYKKKDGAKIMTGYAVGSVCVLVFLAVFFSLFSTLAAREHYAFAKIAQYFPALTVVGRIDLLFVYMLCVILFCFVAMPLHFSADFTQRLFPKLRRPWFAAALAFAAFLFTLFCNKYYDGIYAFFGNYLAPVFWLFTYLFPLLIACFTGNFTPKGKKEEKKEKAYA